jgi:oligopeptide/dipeptide ABC transporter ATP-binding protein
MVESTSEDKTDKAPLLEISNLRVHFDTMDGPVEALHDVNLTVEEGQIMGIVGESGCGKSVTSLTAIGLATCEVDEGSITFCGDEMVFTTSERNKNLELISTRVSVTSVFLSIISFIWLLIEPVQGAALLFISVSLLIGGVLTSFLSKTPALAHERFMRTIRGNEISMIFQEPMTALNPLYSVEKQISEVMSEHDRLAPRDISKFGRISRALFYPFSILIQLFKERKQQLLFTSFLFALVLAQGFSGPLSDWDEKSLVSGFKAINLSWIFFPLVPALATLGLDDGQNRASHAISLMPSSFSLSLVLYLALWMPFSVFMSITAVFAMFAIPSMIASDYLKLDPNHRDQVVEILKQVQIPNPESVVSMFPHELSGGMRQRVMIAMMMSCEPKLLIADEPTTALDVTIQAQILSLMRNLRKEKGTSIMLITHDLGVIAEMCDFVTVMYAGRVVEKAPIGELFDNPRHAYTRGLLASSPSLDSERKSVLPAIPGQVAQPSDFVSGCRFCQRMGRTGDTLTTRPEMEEISPGHWVENCPECVGGSDEAWSVLNV